MLCHWTRKTLARINNNLAATRQQIDEEETSSNNYCTWTPNDEQKENEEQL